MKKFFTMFCALMVMLSVSAAPKKVAFNPEKVGARKVMVTKQKAQLEVMPTAKQAVPGAMRVAKKINEVVTIDMTAATDVDLDDYTTVAGQEWFQMQAEDENYYFSLCINTDHLVGTFTPAEFDMEYTYLYAFDEQGGYEEIVFSSAITATVSGNETDGYTFYAELNGEDGNEYHVTMYYYEAPFVPTGDTIEVVITEPMTYKYYASEGDWYLKGANNDYSVTLDLVNNDSVSPAGIYTADDVLASYTYVTVKATSTKLTMVDIEAVVTDTNNRYDVVANMLCSDGNVYHITMFFAIPEALYFDTIVATNLEVEPYEFWGFILGYTATASNAGYQVALSFDADTTGVYEASGTITPLNGSATKIYSGNINLTNVGGDYTITGSVLCQNNTEYTLNLSFVMPTKTRDVVFLGTDDMFNDYTATDGLWQMIGYNQDSTQFMSITVYSDVIGGNYTRANMYKAYCSAYDLVGDSIVAEYKFLDLDISVQEDTLGVILAGTVLAQNIANTADVPEFTVLMKYIRPQASREVTVVIDAEVTDLTADYGVWQIRGYNATGDVYVSVAAYANQLAGAYNNSMLYQDYTVAVEFVGADTVYYNAVEADFTVTIDAANNVVLAGDILFQNEANRADVPLYHLTMNSVLKTGIDYDEEEDDFNRTYSSYDVEDQYLEQYGVVFVLADDGESEIILEFLTPEEGIVDGTYPINQSEQTMTVWAGDGWDNQGYPNYSYVLTYSGQSIQKIWFLVEGTVTVQSGKITVDAVNSYERTIHAVLNAGTGVEEVKAAENNNTEKFMRNGNLIIRHNGVEYNAQGAEL